MKERISATSSSLALTILKSSTGMNGGILFLVINAQVHFYTARQ
jgi:hypothetical protein